MDMLALADREGIVDMTREAIARRTGVPIEQVRQAIVALETIDKHSSSQEEGGRRLLRLDNHRDWGWIIVNYSKYRDLISLDGRRFANAERMRRYRAKKKSSCSATQQVCSPTCYTSEEESEAIPEAISEKTKILCASSDARFGEFWELWPRKINKKPAAKAWRKQATSDAKAAKIIQAVQDQRDYLTRNGTEYCPHPSTWLNQERYDDDPKELVVKSRAEIIMESI